MPLIISRLLNERLRELGKYFLSKMQWNRCLRVQTYEWGKGVLESRGCKLIEKCAHSSKLRVNSDVLIIEGVLFWSKKGYSTYNSSFAGRFIEEFPPKVG